MRNTKKTKGKTAKDYAVGSVIAAIAAAGLAFGTLFSSPEDVLNNDACITPPFEISDCMIYDNDIEPDAQTDETQEKKQKGIRASLRQFILKLPLSVRAFAGVPVWIIGRVLLAVLSTLFTAVLSPILGTVLKYLCIAGVILAAVVISVKAVMPDIPLKEIVTGRRIAISAVISALFGLCGVIVGIFYPESMKTYEIIESGLITVIVAFAAFSFAAKIKKRGAAQETSVQPQS